jgi:hypothetical protein
MSSRPTGRQLVFEAGDDRALADQGLAGQQAHGRDLARVGLGRDDPDRLVDHHRQGAFQLGLGAVGQHQGLAGLDLAADVVDPLAVDRHKALADQGLGLASRADAVLGQPAIDALRLGFVIEAGPGHGRGVQRSEPDCLEPVDGAAQPPWGRRRFIRSETWLGETS